MQLSPATTANCSDGARTKDSSLAVGSSMPGSCCLLSPLPSTLTAHQTQSCDLGSAPGRRVAASFGPAALFWETPSQRPQKTRLGSPPIVVSSTGSPVVVPRVQPRLLFGSSQSPTRAELLDFASPTREQSLGMSSDGQAINTTPQRAESPWRPQMSPGTSCPATAPETPKRVAAGPRGAVAPWFSASPLRVAHVRHSPSAPSLSASSTNSGGRPSGERSSSLGSKGGGDTPRNMTDWRRSLSMARSNRQDDNDGLRAPVAHVSPGCGGSGSNSAASPPVVGDCSNGAGSVRKAQPWR